MTDTCETCGGTGTIVSMDRVKAGIGPPRPILCPDCKPTKCLCWVVWHPVSPTSSSTRYVNRCKWCKSPEERIATAEKEVERLKNELQSLTDAGG